MYGITDTHPEVVQLVASEGYDPLTAINAVRSRRIVQDRLRTEGRALRQRSLAKW